jgi:hypothetical protein
VKALCSFLKKQSQLKLTQILNLKRSKESD